MPSSYALRQAFMPQKASQKFGIEPKMTLCGTKHVYEIKCKLTKLVYPFRLNHEVSKKRGRENIVNCQHFLGLLQNLKLGKLKGGFTRAHLST